MSSPSLNEVATGVVLGETYEIAGLLGEGGMGSVWEARHLRLPGKRFAVKVLHASASADREAYARFRREAEIASRIGHPNIIEVLDWNVLPSGTPYLVLEFLDGEDLAQRLAGGPVSLEQALSIARQIGAALKAAHGADVVHRDLKPGNVFLVPRESGGEMLDHVKVLDFGISKIRNSQTVQTQDAVLLGTPQYMAPEQALGKNHEIDGRTDVFALGAIVYEMISGKPAFQGNTLAEVVFKVVYEPIVPLVTLVPSVGAEVSAAIERAMAKAPGDRFPDVSSFITALTGRSLATTDRRSVRGSSIVDTSAATLEDPAADPASSMLRGELQTTQVAMGKSRRLLFLVIAVVVGAGGTFAAVTLLGKPGVHAPNIEPRPTVAVSPPPATLDPTPPPTQVATPIAKKVEDKPHVDKVRAEKVESFGSPELRAKLDEAERLLAAREYEKARLEASRSMMLGKTSKAYSIMTRAYCHLSDLGNARASLQHVSGADRARVVKECHGTSAPLD